MTDKQKQIKELAEFIYDSSPCASFDEDDALHVASELYKAGYRKQSEVTLGILEEVDNLLWRHKMRGRIDLNLIHEDLIKLKKKDTGGNEKHND